MFIVLEGLDGSGKTTIAAMLAASLSATTFKFPDAKTPMGALIYQHLEGHWACHPTTDRIQPQDVPLLNAYIFQALQLTNRLERLPELERALATGHVVADRYWHSGFAFGSTDGIDGRYLVGLHESLPQPDLHVLLRIEPDTSVKRRPLRRDYYEANATHRAGVARKYDELWAHHIGERAWLAVDAELTAEVVHGLILQEAQRLIDERKSPDLDLFTRAEGKSCTAMFGEACCTRGAGHEGKHGAAHAGLSW